MSTDLVALRESTRRRLLGQMTTGFAGLALGQMLSLERMPIALGDASAERPPAKAKRVLQIFCPGAASHIDLWDYKPALEKHHGEPLPGAEGEVSFQGKNGNLMKSPWAFTPAGESGKPISSLLPNMARHVDGMAFIHSMTSKSNTHGPGCIFMNSCFTREGFPTAGAWVS